MSMTAHTRHKSTISVPGRNTPGATFIAFSLTGKIAPCGPHIVLRRARVRHHKKLTGAWGLLMLKLLYLQTAHNSDKRSLTRKST
jgi:hypothetical protein